MYVVMSLTCHFQFKEMKIRLQLLVDIDIAKSFVLVAHHGANDVHKVNCIKSWGCNIPASKHWVHCVDNQDGKPVVAHRHCQRLLWFCRGQYVRYCKWTGRQWPVMRNICQVGKWYCQKVNQRNVEITQMMTVMQQTLCTLVSWPNHKQPKFHTSKQIMIQRWSTIIFSVLKQCILDSIPSGGTHGNVENHTVYFVVSWPNHEQWTMVHNSKSK